MSDPAATFADPRFTLAGLGGKLVYFTIQSNLLLAAVAAWSVVAEVRHRPGPSAWFVGGAAFFVTITFAVYNTVLVPGGGDGAVLLLSGRPSSDLLHVVAPLLALLDWVLLRPHPGAGARRSLLWLVYPVLYFVFVLVRGALTTGPPHYPYPFVDVDELGYGGVALSFAVLAPSFAVLALGFAGLDHLLGRRRALSGGTPPAGRGSGAAGDVAAPPRG
nr:Pr6Pr family membrane protein [Kineococcus siccus]